MLTYQLILLNTTALYHRHHNGVASQIIDVITKTPYHVKYNNLKKIVCRQLELSETYKVKQ